MNTLKNLTGRILTKISEYAEIDAKEIFEQGDWVAIFGGAVRDSIAQKDIHDIDILCLPESACHLRDFIVSKGYEAVNLYDKDQWEQYKHVSVISEPWVFMRGRKIIQIIRPKFLSKIDNSNHFRFTNGTRPLHMSRTDPEAIEAYYTTLSGVDLTCCGVFIEKNNSDVKFCTDPKNEIILKESYKNAILHCLVRMFEVKEYSGMYDRERTTHREYKLLDRGWKNLKKGEGNWQLKYERILKLAKIEYQPEYYCSVYEPILKYKLRKINSTATDEDFSNFFDSLNY